MIIVAAVIAVGVLAAGVWAQSFAKGIEKQVQKPAVQTREFKKAVVAPKPHKPFTVLLMGMDTRPGETASRTDTIIVMKVDPEKRKVWMISIPRDTKVQIPGHGVGKINSAHFLGGAKEGPSLAVKTVSQFLGIPINHYMEIDFWGFRRVVDTLGGVWINVDQPINDYKAANHNKRFQYVKAGYQRLDGGHALTYVRSRKFADADFTRMRHQQTFFKALAKQSVQMKSLTKLPAVGKALARYTVTDMSISDVVAIASQMRGMPESGIQAATLPGVWRSPYVVPNEAAKRRLVSAFKSGGSLEASSTVKPKTAATASIAVRNGAGVAGAATKMRDLLKAKGFKVASVGNAREYGVKRTLVVYRPDSAAAARKIAGALPGSSVVQDTGTYGLTSDVLVVVGLDWVAKNASATSSTTQ